MRSLMLPSFSKKMCYRILVLTLALATPGLVGRAEAKAATPAETFVSENIQRSLQILNDKGLSPAQRSGQFQEFLLSVTDLKRIALFTLGPYQRTTSQADREAFAASFQDYAIAVYQSYFAKYAGQTLKIVSSNERAPGDFIVSTAMVDPNDHSGQQPLGIEFRVRTDSGNPVLTDFSVAGIWLAIEERDQFTAFLSRNDGSIPTLIGHLNELRQNLVRR
jgi:phospholipid transport system substrate-binding protein